MALPASTPSSKPLKIAVRMLPPKLSEAEFRESIASWKDKVSWMRYEQGDVPEEKSRHITFSVAYLKFASSEAAAAFSEDKDGAAYRDSTGGMTRCQTATPFWAE